MPLLRFSSTYYYCLRYQLGLAQLTTTVSGIICFTFFKKAGKAVKGGRKNSIFGLGLALASLFCDGFVGPTQEAIFSQYKSSTHQMMYYTNLWAMVLLTVAMIITGDGSRAVGFVAKNPAVSVCVCVCVCVCVWC